MIEPAESKRIVIATIGSLGDLHPCLALALELGHRGHRVTIASTEFYRRKVEGLGIAFQPLRPNWNPTDQELIRQCEDLKQGPEVLYRRLILPELRNTYDDLLSIATDADLMIAGELVYAAPLVAEKLDLRWASAILSPSSFFSSRDPSVLVSVPWLLPLRKAGWPIYSAALNLCKLATKHWSDPVRRLRIEEKLRPQCDPVFRDKFSPDLVLALFSHLLARPQIDWPPQTLQTGFVSFDREAAEAAAFPPQLAAFLAEGDPPIVFTQGSAAAHNPGNFYQVSVEAARLLGRRAVLLGAKAAPHEPSPYVLALPYAPYSQVFPYASVNVHQGGSGTTAQALQSGRPMLIVPYGWDQPDNAVRIERLGVGLHVARKAYTASTAPAALKRLLNEPHFAAQAAEAAASLQQECGLKAASDAIEAALSRSRSATAAV